jgi:hypothetical protein
MAEMTYDESLAYLDDLYRWFKRNREALIKGHHGESVLIHDNRALGYYPDFDAAVDAAEEMGLEDGSYLAHDCLYEDEDYLLFLPFGARPRSAEGRLCAV